MLEKEESKHSVPANKPQREGIWFLRKRKASIQFQQTSIRERGFDAWEKRKQAVPAGELNDWDRGKQASERGDVMLDKEESKHSALANKPQRGIGCLWEGKQGVLGNKLHIEKIWGLREGKARKFNAWERGKQGVLVNKPHREGIECLREGKASKHFQQTSLTVKVFIEKEGG